MTADQRPATSEHRGEWYIWRRRRLVDVSQVHEFIFVCRRCSERFTVPIAPDREVRPYQFLDSLVHRCITAPELLELKEIA